MKNIVALFACLFLNIMLMNATIKLPWILSDDMVIQRNVPVNIWGWAESGEKISVSFSGQQLNCIADQNGNWKVQLHPAEAGGPYELTISGNNEIILKNILVGDIWVCSGQSNMEWPLNMSRNWERDKNDLFNENIRLFQVPKKMSPTPLENIDSSCWQVCNLKTVESFSAVGYYFAKNLQTHLNVPVGLISSNWGGTVIETWTSLDVMYNDPEYKNVINEMSGLDFKEVIEQSKKKIQEWNETVQHNDPGKLNHWESFKMDDHEWQTMNLPHLWEGVGYPKLDGVAWFRKEIELTEKDIKNKVILSLGPIDDSDESFVNGVSIGSTYNQYSKPRKYEISSNVLKIGKNVISVKVIDTGGGGGIWGDENDMYIELGENKIPLKGSWKYKIAIDKPFPQDGMSPNRYPSFLYNAMIHPLLKFPIKGVLWYQGESNANRYEKYRTQFHDMIVDWRKRWNVGDFPFLFVQLANFVDQSIDQEKCTWAGLREAQTMALQLPAAGMAVTIDIGDPKDIHPRNKDDVGYRLYLAARKVAYGENLVYSGPIFKNAKVVGNSMIIEFDQIGSGLMIEEGATVVKGFTLAGNDKKFYEAEAMIDNQNRVVISSSMVINPVAVRYAWSDNPEDANLFNKEKLPVSPFRSDNW